MRVNRIFALPLLTLHLALSAGRCTARESQLQMVTTINLVDTDEESPPPQSKLTSNPSLNNNNRNHTAINTTSGINAIAGPSNAGINRITKNGRNSNASFATSGTTIKGKGKGKETEEVIMLSSDDDDDDGGAGDRTVTARRPPIVNSPFLQLISSFVPLS